MMKKIVDNYVSVLKNFSDVAGRAGRSEYWYFVLASMIISIGLAIFSSMIGNHSNALGSLYNLIVLIPGVAVGVRRLHDIGKSGWMLLVSFIPLIGWIWLIILLATGSNPEENQYGPVPKPIKSE